MRARSGSRGAPSSRRRRGRRQQGEHDAEPRAKPAATAKPQWYALKFGTTPVGVTVNGVPIATSTLLSTATPIAEPTWRWTLKASTRRRCCACGIGGERRGLARDEDVRHAEAEDERDPADHPHVRAGRRRASARRASGHDSMPRAISQAWAEDRVVSRVAICDAAMTPMRGREGGEPAVERRVAHRLLQHDGQQEHRAEEAARRPP